MIEYYKGAYGIGLLFRLHGSAVYKTIIPGIISVLLFWWYRTSISVEDNDVPFDAPYAVGVLVSAVSFLIVFRANNSYQRYWEACGSIHHFLSKTLDATVQTAAFHMQSQRYIDIKPPAFFDYPELKGKNVSRDRLKKAENKDILGRRQRLSINAVDPTKSRNICFGPLREKEDMKHVNGNDDPPQSPTNARLRKFSMVSDGSIHRKNSNLTDGGWGKLDETRTNSASGRKDRDDQFGNTPSLFLQELAHLSSLYIAVAFSTLRNVEGEQSPLDSYVPGSKWPAADPHRMSTEEKEDISIRMRTSWWQELSYWIGMDASPALQAKLNTARPMLVVGGVSESEIAQLQRARGASAKTTLAFYWLVEFIAREHLAGSTGNVGSPIISRLFQFISDGSTHYNHARKTAFIPFPFPHAQLSALFIFVMIFFVPLMMYQYTNELWLGISLTFLTVSCLAGLHEVGRELENPFKNAPNDIPLPTLLAMYNESLITMCTGYHPDAYWNENLKLGRREQSEPDFVE